jgi:hypothetical protein
MYFFSVIASKYASIEKILGFARGRSGRAWPQGAKLREITSPVLRQLAERPCGRWGQLSPDRAAGCRPQHPRSGGARRVLPFSQEFRPTLDLASRVLLRRRGTGWLGLSPCNRAELARGLSFLSFLLRCNHCPPTGLRRNDPGPFRGLFCPSTNK